MQIIHTKQLSTTNIFYGVVRYCQVKSISTTMDGWNPFIKVTGFPLKLLALPFGSTIDSRSAFAILKTCLPKAASQSHRRQFDSGVSSMDRFMHDLCAENRDGSEISGTSMKHSFRSEASDTACGEQWIRMGTLSIFW